MIIDAHTHLPNINHYEGIDALLRSMDEAKIDKAVLIASTKPSPGLTNEQAIKVAGAHADRLCVVMFVSPLETIRFTRERLSEWLGGGLVRGIKFYTGYEHFAPNDMECVAFYCRVAEENDVPVIFHTGDTYNAVPEARIKFAHPLAVDDLAVKFPRLKIIIAHFGYPWITDAAAVVYKNPNVYADISGWVYGKFTARDRRYLTKKLMDAREYLGNLDKILFGTDWPISDQKTYIEFVRRLPISASEKRKILFENAQKLFKL